LLSKLKKLISVTFDGSIIQLKDRENAAEVLYSILKSKLNNAYFDDYLILGVPRGGVVIADIIATKFQCSFDMVIPRRLLSPYNKELSIGAIMKDNTLYLNSSVIKNLKVTDNYLQIEKNRQINEIKKIERILGEQVEGYRIRNKNIILVDDGVATGSTLIVALRWIKKNKPKKVIAVIPVCPKSTLKLLKEEANDVELILAPSTKNFTTIDKYYQNFPELEMQKISEIIKKHES
jgi:putative phosphoribosyl transferase